LTRVELEFLKEARARLARLFFVMNKIDYVSEKDRREILRFVEGVLRKELKPAPVGIVGHSFGGWTALASPDVVH
jgi:hypothetical protein